MNQNKLGCEQRLRKPDRCMAAVCGDLDMKIEVFRKDSDGKWDI